MKLVAALLGLLMLVSCGGDDDVVPAIESTSPPVVTTPPAVTPTTPSVTPTTPTVTPTTPSVSPTTPSVTPTTPACPAFTDSFGRPVTCSEMALLAGANLPFVDGGGGTGDGSGDGGADGSAGDGAPIANTVLRFTDINGKQVTTTTDARGYFRISLRGLKAPLLASVQRDNKPWQSLLITDIVRAPANRRFYTLNLTGLTDVVASELAKRDGLVNPQALTPAALVRQKAQVPAIIAAIKNTIREQIEAAGLDFSTFDPLNTPFEAVLSDKYDVLLERLIIDKDPVGGFSVVAPRYGINPQSPTMLPGGSLDFSTNFTATFAVVGGAANGLLTAAGPGNTTYIAPATPGIYRIVATSTANAANRATATVTVSAGAGFRVSGTPRIAPNTSTQLTALFNDMSTSATWTIEGNCGTCSVNSAGLFTAGSTVASVRVRGTRVSVPSQSDTLAITIASEVILSLNAPSAITVTSSDMFTFNPTISPAGINADVSLAAAPAGDAGSFITVDYFKGYLPPARAGNFAVGVASVADPSKTASIAVAVITTAAPALAATPGAPSSMRYTHAAAALPDGRVLMVGGLADRQSNNRLLTTDVFNPATGNFSAGPSLGLTRPYPEAIAIDANRVLVTGGELDYQTARNTAEVVSLSRQVSDPTPNAMSAPRIHHRMVLLNRGANSGKVLVMGGFNGPVPYGVPTWQATASVDVFDPATDTFTPSHASLRTARGMFTATMLADGRVLIVGGFQPEPGPLGLASAEIYDPVTGTFAFTGSLAIARYGHTATRLADGRVLVVGGINNGNTQSTAEIYDPATGNFSPVSSNLAVTRGYHAASSLADGRVVIFGGESGDFVVRGTVEVFNPANQTFSPYAVMSTPRVRATATALTAGPNAGKVLVFGGGAVNTPAKAAEVTP